MIKVRVKKKKEQYQRRDNVPVEKTEKIDRTYTQTVDIREKRIGIVFKVIYVVAIFFAAMFVTLSAGAGEGLTDAYIIEVAVTTLLLAVLIYMVIYILNEMKCLKLFATDLPQKQIEETENSYSNIFLGLRVSGITVLLGTTILTHIKEYLTGMSIVWAFTIALAFLLVLLSVARNVSRKKEVVLGVVRCVVGTVMLMCVFLLPAFSSVEIVTPQ